MDGDPQDDGARSGGSAEGEGGLGGGSECEVRAIASTSSSRTSLSAGPGRSPSLSRIPLPIGDHGSRNAASSLPALVEGGSSRMTLCSDTPTVLDIRDSGDSAGMSAGEGEGPHGLQGGGQPAEGDTARSSPTTTATPPPPPASPPIQPHALLVEAVVSRSQLVLAAAHDAASAERLMNAGQLLAGPLALTACSDGQPQSEALPEASPLLRYPAAFDCNASELFFSSSNILESIGLTEHWPPESVLPLSPATSATPAPPPPPPTPSPETPDRKASADVAKKQSKVSTARKASSKTVTQHAPSSKTSKRLSSVRLGEASCKGESSVTLIKAPPGAGAAPAASAAPAVRPASARSAQLSQAAGVAQPPGKKPASAVRASSSTVKAITNRRSSMGTDVGGKKDASLREEAQTIRPKSVTGSNSARAKPSRESSSLSASDAISRARVKASSEDQRPKQKPGLAARKVKGADEVKTHSKLPKEGTSLSGEGRLFLSQLDDQLKTVAAAYILLLTDLVPRHEHLLLEMKNAGGEGIFPEFQQALLYASMLGDRQAEAVQKEERSKAGVLAAVSGLWTEWTDVRELLECENKDLMHRLATFTSDLEAERATNTKLKIAKTTQDSTVKQLRSKMKELETKAAEDEAKLGQHSSQIISLKEKLRARDIVAEGLRSKISELQGLETAKQHLDTKLGSVTQMLQIETKIREKAEQKLKVTTAKLSQLEMSKGDSTVSPKQALLSELEALREEKLQLQTQLEQAGASEVMLLQSQMREMALQLEEREQQLKEKNEEVKHLQSFHPDDPTREEYEVLKRTLAELANHNERLEEELSHSRQELAKQDKVMAEQEKVLGVREKLISVLQAKSDQQGLGQGLSQGLGLLRPQEFFSLERKALRLKAYETQIQQMEKQQESFQAQRTRMEKRIAQLEHELALSSRQPSPKCAVPAMPALPNTCRFIPHPSR